MRAQLCSTCARAVRLRLRAHVFDEPAASYDNKRVASSSGPVAQLGARFHGMEEVVGSIPTRSTIKSQGLCDLGLFLTHCPVSPRKSRLLALEGHRREISACRIRVEIGPIL